jgi:RNA polymerase sigma factor (sigma-70 family)
MAMLDGELLENFHAEGNEEAFADLVGRYMDAVYSAARRQVRDPQMAEDVAQAVFIILARKAGKLRHRASLAGWVMETTYLASRDALRGEARRRRHEQRAAMESQLNQEKDMQASSGELSAQVDAGLAKLSEADRGVLVLRYLQGQSVSEAAAALEISEAAVTKRISRALSRLRRTLAASGAETAGLSVGTALEQLPRMQAPGMLANSAAAVAVRGANPAGVAIADGVIHHLIWGKVAAIVARLIGIGGIATAGVVGMKMLVDAPVAPATGPATPVVAGSPEVPKAIIAQLADGVSISILGLHDEMYSPMGWWSAGGEPLHAPPCAGMQYRSFNATGKLARALVLRINREVRGSSDPATVGWSVKNSGGWSQRRIEGLKPANAEAAVVSVPDNPAGVVLHAKIASGKWVTIGTWKADGPRDVPAGKIGVVVGEPFAVGGGAHVVVAYDNPKSIDDYRVVGFDSLDQPVVMMRIEVAGYTGMSNESLVEEYAVQRAAGAIRRVEFQTRPFNEFIEIQNISVHANQMTVPVIKTSDGAQAPAAMAPSAPMGGTAFLSVVTGPWKTLYSIRENGPYFHSLGDWILIWGRSYTFIGETHKIMLYNQMGNFDSRVVAVGAEGQQEVAGVWQTADINDRLGVETRIAEYSVKMPLKSVQQWLFQVRGDARAHRLTY